ncbi:acyl-CoA dehydrogenase [Pontibacillus halophilus JSM 076056 = DSM 19796]|uniref:Acyl-CoA dehydrogenase n=1 Tax=Pontibacillus halophilus JSM 076056 = DSM 19796 TaxID=1385510 RepID=A0A0A5GJF1_9BACI|nr:acyl-CoA dehydrogenase [Pontibacillus halophilus]KGX91280.1 acyl-CoA dehydrogenase [Pontibacillus halophilus JSM 076056 = DSM 19796]
MNELYTPFIRTERHKALFMKVEELAKFAKKYSKEMDEQADFSPEVLNKLKESNYVSWPLSLQDGGKELTLYELLLLQERLAVGDGATALSIGWHMNGVMELRDERMWSDELYQWLAKEVGTNKKVLNRIATEPATGSPARGGRPETTAVKNGSQYVINGRKTFTSMASVLDYYLVSAYLPEEDGIGWFMIDAKTPGIKVDPTWNTVGMRGTGSHDLLLSDVSISDKYLVETGRNKSTTPKGWLMHIPACYIGIAIAARNDAIEFAKNFQPNTLNTPISEVPHIQDKIGQMELKLLHARSFMYSVADQWDRYPDQRERLGPSIQAVKTVVTNAATEIVDLAMRIAGGRGLSKDYQFEKYYRDVRAGLHNPPADDSVLMNLAKHALNEHE